MNNLNIIKETLDIKNLSHIGEGEDGLEIELYGEFYEAFERSLYLKGIDLPYTPSEFENNFDKIVEGNLDYLVNLSLNHLEKIQKEEGEY